MTNLLTADFVQTALNSSEQFPIDFDDVWVGLGYAKKQNATDNLIDWFEKGYDFNFTQKGEVRLEGKREVKRQIDKYFLTTDVYKEFCMMSRTDKGKEVRKYFIDVEKQYRQNLNRLLAQPVEKVKDNSGEIIEHYENQLTDTHKKYLDVHKKYLDLSIDYRLLEAEKETLLYEQQDMFEENRILQYNWSFRDEFEVTIDDAIDCLNPLPKCSYGAKRQWIEQIIIKDGSQGVDYIRSRCGLRLNYRFLIEVAVFYRGQLGVQSKYLPEILMLEKERVFKNSDNKVNTRFPNQSV